MSSTTGKLAGSMSSSFARPTLRTGARRGPSWASWRGWRPWTASTGPPAASSGSRPPSAWTRPSGSLPCPAPVLTKRSALGVQEHRREPRLPASLRAADWGPRFPPERASHHEPQAAALESPTRGLPQFPRAKLVQPESSTRSFAASMSRNCWWTRGSSSDASSCLPFATTSTRTGRLHRLGLSKGSEDSRFEGVRSFDVRGRGGPRGHGEQHAAELPANRRSVPALRHRFTSQSFARSPLNDPLLA